MQLWRRWPTLMAVVLLVLNVDLVVMPLLTMVSIDGWRLAVSAAAICSLEVAGWNWYSVWFARNLQKSDAARRTVRQFRYQGMLRKAEESYYGARDTLSDVQDWFVDHAQENLAVNTPAKQRLLDSALAVLSSSPRWMQYPLMFGLGFFPLGWAPAILIMRVHRVRGSMAFFMASNAIKTVGLGFVYLWLPLWSKIAIWAVLALAVCWQFRKWSRDRRNATDSL